VEVKGPRDRLSDQQKAWLAKFAEINLAIHRQYDTRFSFREVPGSVCDRLGCLCVPLEVCHVKENHEEDQ
jgi:hypothetical protein